ncbi:hypothetical protein JCM9140_4454 [Halalkalibacter wakoensis JCM 9140]|uniref:Restriction endonuclease type II NgoFVII N-terminal domain-containing protein n=1 Tax=Halalkalibacter wakoensis JCM 9140 TaxID=1236970 RepID=W4Q843_9BACI|nr:restriction endonuclease PLD domain-containing protein [Halalkalibacter wakoensis]GAE28241.1 hypothetical protein JCM9140_4454 [Halalkalibacter wakoensis JCM 9140]
MIYTENLLEDIIIKPYREGLQELSVVTGQTSPAFIHHLLYSLEKLELKIIIGLANEKTIPIWDHNEYVKLTQNTGRLSINYYLGSPPIHSNIYIWSNQLKN